LVFRCCIVGSGIIGTAKGQESELTNSTENYHAITGKSPGIPDFPPRFCRGIVVPQEENRDIISRLCFGGGGRG
jgi:hypothetical protein